MSDTPLDKQGLPRGYAFDPNWEITPRQLREMRERGEQLMLLDCRTPEEAQTADMGADMLVPMQQLGQRLSELEPHRDRKIVVHCHHGRRSLTVVVALRRLGFEDVTSLAGGIDLWSRDVDANVPRY